MSNKPVGPILYFVEGLVPTNAEFKKASKFMNTGPMFEFVSLAQFDPANPKNVAPEKVTGVAGKVPEFYKSAPTLDTVAETLAVIEKIEAKK